MIAVGEANGTVFTDICKGTAGEEERKCYWPGKYGKKRI